MEKCEEKIAKTKEGKKHEMDKRRGRNKRREDEEDEGEGGQRKMSRRKK